MPLTRQKLDPFTIPLPFGGVSEAAAFTDQPDGTTVDALNVLPRDPRTDRRRISKRPGLVNLFNEQLNGTHPIQDINEVVVSLTETIFEELDAPEEEWTADLGVDIKAVAVDPDGYVYVVGDRDAVGGKSVWKLDPDDGTTLDSYDTGANAKGIAITPNADTWYIHVVGASPSGSGVHLWKLDTDLTLQWQADMGVDSSVMYGVAVDDDGNVYVTGDRNTQWNGQGSGSGVQRNVWKLTSAGAFSDEHNLGATINPVALALLENRTVAVCGDRVSSKSVWWTDFSTTLGSADAGTNAKGVAIDGNGRTVVVGTNTSGVNMWVFNADRTLHSTHDIGGGSVNLTGIAIDRTSGDMFVVGTRANGASVWKVKSDFTTKWAYDSGVNAAGVGIGLEGDIVLAQAASGGESVAQLATSDEQTVIRVPRTKKYIAIAGNEAKRFEPGVGFIDIQGGGMRTGKPVYSTQAFSKVYFVDGNNYRVWDPIANTFLGWVPTAGNLPDDTTGEGNSDTGKAARLICTWRGRVVLSAAGADPHNWFMSAVGDPLDWDYSPADQSESQAVAGNNSPAGLIGDVVTALIPYNDDLLLFGADASVWRMTGDPMAGGRIDLVSDITGIAFGKAWCKDPEGFVYFFGSTGGMYRMAPGGIPERLSNTRIERELQDVDTGASIIRMAWDHRLQGVWLTIMPTDANLTGRHYFWDKRDDGFWPIEFYDSRLDPFCLFTIDGDSPEDRQLLFGTRNGYIRYLDHEAAWDAPAEAGGQLNPIEAHVWLGPMMGGGDREIKVRGWSVVMGENTDAATLEAYAGDSPEEAFGSTALWSKALVAGRNGRINERARGAAVFGRISNTAVNEFFSIEQVVAQPIPGGRVRVRS